MTREEFISQVRGITKDTSFTISGDDYKTIEYVYTWHPAIADVGGKQQIAMLYIHGGMLVIRDMVSRAQRAEKADGKMREIRRDIAGMEAKLAELQQSILT